MAPRVARTVSAFANSVVISEIALAFVLLAGAGLMIESFLWLQAVNPGFATHNILTVKIKPSRGNYRDQQQRAALFRRDVHRVGTARGVESAGAIDILPLTEGSPYFPVEIEGEPAVAADERRFANYHAVSPTYLPRQRNLWVTDIAEWCRETRLVPGEPAAR